MSRIAAPVFEAAAEPLWSRAAEARLLGRGWCTCQRLRPSHRTLLTAHLLALSPEDRRGRFSFWPSDQSIRQHCEGLDLAKCVAFGAFDGDGDLIGAAIAFGPPGPGAHTVEVAVTVAQRHRRQGIGSALAARACAAAAAEGANGALFVFEPTNHPVKALVRALGGQCDAFAEECLIPLARFWPAEI